MIAVVGVALTWVGAFAIFGHAFAAVGSDAWNYLAAGERLNAGHELYGLMSGDRFVLLDPPYWSVPLLSPPPIAVVWRALALLGDGSMYLWWAGGLAACLWLQVSTIRQGSVAQIVLTVAASPFLALTAVSGNANAYLVPMLAWSAGRREHQDMAGAAVAVAAAVKLTPILLVPWVVLRHGIRGFLLASVLILLVTIVGAGPGSIPAWWNAVDASAPSPLSLANLLHVSPAVVAMTVGILVLAATAVFRARDRAHFALGVVGTIAATPALYFQSLALVATLPNALATRETPIRGERFGDMQSPAAG